MWVLGAVRRVRPVTTPWLEGSLTKLITLLAHFPSIITSWPPTLSARGVFCSTGTGAYLTWMLVRYFFRMIEDIVEDSVAESRVSWSARTSKCLSSMYVSSNPSLTMVRPLTLRLHTLSCPCSADMLHSVLSGSVANPDSWSLRCMAPSKNLNLSMGGRESYP